MRKKPSERRWRRRRRSCKNWKLEVKIGILKIHEFLVEQYSDCLSKLVLPRQHFKNKILILSAKNDSEAAVRRCSVKMVFWKISQNSQENTCPRLPFLIKLQTWGLQKFPSSYKARWFDSEAAVRRRSVKMVFWKISQNSQENTCPRLSFLMRPATLLKKKLWHFIIEQLWWCICWLRKAWQIMPRILEPLVFATFRVCALHFEFAH